METKTLSVAIVFVAVTVALNPAISQIAIPFPPLPFLLYQIWEIPIVIAFVLINKKVGSLIAILNTVILTIFFPGALPTGPLYNLAATASMLLGIYLIQKILKSKNTAGLQQNYSDFAKTKFVVLSTALGIILRVIVMSIVNYVSLRYPYPIGFELNEAAIIGSLPLTAVFNATLALYTIPVGLYVAKAIKNNLRL